jgi:DNA-binding response OmpR family regulator
MPPWRTVKHKPRGTGRGSGCKTLMMTGSPDRIMEFDGAGQPYLSKPFPPDVFLKRVQEMLAAG